METLHLIFNAYELPIRIIADCKDRDAHILELATVAKLELEEYKRRPLMTIYEEFREAIYNSLSEKKTL